MYELSVTVKNSSNNEVEQYDLFLDDEEVNEEPIETEEGKHTIKVSSKGLKDVERDIEVSEDTHKVVKLSPSEDVFVNPSQETLENLTNAEFARAVENSSHLIEVDKASNDHVELYSPEAEKARIDIVDNEKPKIAHNYAYIANVVVESDSKYRYDDTDAVKKNAFYQRFNSPLRAVREIEEQIGEEVDSIF
jgi:hypothetical protein